MRVKRSATRITRKVIIMIGTVIRITRKNNKNKTGNQNKKKRNDNKEKVNKESNKKSDQNNENNNQEKEAQ